MYSPRSKSTKNIGTNLTVWFPVTSNRGNTFLFSIYDHNRNILLVYIMKAITDKEFFRIFQALHDPLNTQGLKPSYTHLKNESSPDLHNILKDKVINYQQ